MSEIIEFVVLAYTMGPIMAVPYGINELGLRPLMLFFYLAAIYITPLPFLMGIYELGGSYLHTYKSSLLDKFSRVTDRKIKEVVSAGDEIEELFEHSLGHLGFYVAIAVFTFLFGIFWATLLAYVLKVEKKKALFSIAAGVLVGDAFWLLVLAYLWPLKNMVDAVLLLAVLSLLAYGKKRENDVIRWISSRIRRTKSTSSHGSKEASPQSKQT